MRKKKVKKKSKKVKKYGIPIELKWIPFKELVNPERLCFDYYPTSHSKALETRSFVNSRPLSTIKSTTLEALRLSIEKYGLLNPLKVVPLEGKLKEQIDFLIDPNIEIYDWEKYVIIDGQRRYFAIRKIICPPKWVIAYQLRQQGMTDPQEKQIELARIQYYKGVEVLCEVYPYYSINLCVRHSVEDNKFSVRPSREYLDSAERETELLEQKIEFCKKKKIPKSWARITGFI